MIHSVLSTIFDITQLTCTYWLCFLSFAFFKNEYSRCAYFLDDIHARVQVFSLSLIFKLWSEPHYRSRDFQEDMLNNLKNVAVPGTGFALSWFCYSKFTAYWFVLFANPVICFLAAIHQSNKTMKQNVDVSGIDSNSSLSSTFISPPSSPNRSMNHHLPPTSPAGGTRDDHIVSFIESFGDSILQFFNNLQYSRYYGLIYDQYYHNLLHPDDWFSLWRMNCRLVSYHSFVTKSEDYKMEDKWTFLTKGKDMNVPITPYFDKIESLVCKNKLIEGGMGIHFYRNAAFGGEWIIQEKLQNVEWLNDLLPHNAPLSTMRVITTSTYTISDEFPKKKEQQMKKVVSNSGINNLDILFEKVDGTTSSQNTNLTTEATDDATNENNTDMNGLTQARSFIHAESGVLRLGRMNANTDHSSILFDVDLKSGLVKPGTTNAHWYQLGMQKIVTTPWLPPKTDILQHIDYPYPVVAGKQVPEIQKAIDIVVSAHFKMMPEVPIVGWDVAFTPNGIFLLEVNLSCNFFKGSFNLPKYIEFLDKYWMQLEKMEKLNQDQSTPEVPASQKKYRRRSFKHE